MSPCIMGGGAMTAMPPLGMLTPASSEDRVALDSRGGSGTRLQESSEHSKRTEQAIQFR